MTGWTAEDTEAYRAEVERRFAERTPPTRVDEALVGSRVGRGELRNWAQEHRGKLPPETDIGWLARHALWYRSMSLRVVKEKDPDAYQAARREIMRSGRNTVNSQEQLRRDAKL